MHSKRVIDAARRVEAEFDNRATAAVDSEREWSYTQKVSDAIWRDECKQKLLEFQDAHIAARAILEIGEGVVLTPAEAEEVKWLIGDPEDHYGDPDHPLRTLKVKLND